MDFKKINNWTGWLVTLIACTVYIMTSEAASSFWDCGEFISSAYKLQIPHPPGAPMFVLLGRVFIILFGDNPLTAAKAVNTMSALASGFTILFLFWTITHFAKRIVVKQTGTEPVGYQILAIMGAGIVGALAYTFSDSFWYSAVEGEVYALSSFFTALVFWAILKWEHKADQPGADKWIIFIFYMMGLSIGVHLLNILTIPAIVMVYYFRQYKPTITGGLVAFLVGVVITGFIQVVLIQYTIKWAGAFDVNFVNSMGLPFFSGFIFFFVLLAAILTWGINYANKKGLYFLKLGVWSMIFMLLGYTTYITTMIRSNADPSVDMYNVDNPVTLVGYLGREQYGDWPILFGPDYVDKVDNIENGDQYVKAPTNYELAGKNYKRDWSSAPSSHLFPRMWDGENDRGQMDSYKAFAGVVDGEAPTLRDNIKYFTNYQFGFMYLRYFLWNFAGKQNDLQGFGNVRDGNFSTGISFIDNFFFGDQSKLPDTIKNNNKAHNSLFMLPFFLGLFGFLFQYQQNKKDFIVTGLLFFFTGLAIVLYLNQVSLQPRERDYAYVGSFYAFAIWIGLGVLQVIQWLTKVVNQKTASVIATVVCLLAVPALMAQQEWDDHDRSQKLLPRDLARNYLESCPPNAILFSFGDNDTYPLWYAQEVEGIRPDVRVVVNSLLGSDWYMRELRYKVNESNKFDVIFSEEQVSGNKLNVAYYNALPEYGETRYHNLDSVLRYVIGDPSGKYMASTTDGPVNIFPTHKFKVPVNKANALASGIAKPTDTMVDELLIDFNPNRQYLLKNELAMYAIIATSDFKRPICFTSTQELKELGLDKYVRQTGMSYQLVPVMNQTIDAEVAYKNMMTKFSFGNAKNPNVYFDEENRRHLNSMRLAFSQVAQALAIEGKRDSAQQLLRKFDAETNEKNFPYGMTSNRGNQHNYFSYLFLQACYASGELKLANKVSVSLLKDLKQAVAYYKSLGEAMSDDQFFVNAENAYQGKPNSLVNKQIAFVQDILTCGQLIEAINKMEKDFTVAKK
ncbi:MAG: DUF2723 domain-containing protein [Sediminibacterium sp.]|jgi:hypothetical protein|nr:DUF2723 domain-containing protein [Sediminibacterium sp.]